MHFPSSVRAELVEALSFSVSTMQKERPFDKLGANANR